MRTDVIYRFVFSPTEHTYVTFDEGGMYTEHYSMKRARLLRPDAPVIVMKAVQ